MNPRSEKVIALLLLGIGVEAWLVLGDGIWGHRVQLWWLAGALAAWATPPTRHVVSRLLDCIRHPSPRTTRLATIGIAVLAAVYLFLTAHLQHRDLAPFWHDEFCYLIQARIVAHNRLWMPPHPLGEFFDSFYLITHSAYAPMYFPGAAMMFAPAVKLGLPVWVTPLMACAASVGLLYRITTELIDGVAGALAVMLLLATSEFRWASMVLMGQGPMILLGLLMLWAWLRWRASPVAWRWELLIGGVAGWAAITRPLDALCYILPVGIALLGAHRGWTGRRIARLAIGALPFLAMQIIFNIGVTGHWLQTPYQLYSDRDQPGVALGFHRYDPTAHPVSEVPEKREFYEREYRESVRDHRPSRIPELFRDRLSMTLHAGLPHPLLILLIPLSVLALNRRRAVFWAMLPLFAGLYALYPCFPGFYCAMAAPAAAFIVTLSLPALASAWPGCSRGSGALLALLLTATAVSSLPEIDRTVFDDVAQRPAFLDRVDEALSTIHRPAIVLFRSNPGDPDAHLMEEPVYNADVAWPDDAQIIRAHDLGARNARLFAYYARLQPGREVYRYDERGGLLQYMGTVRHLTPIENDHTPGLPRPDSSSRQESGAKSPGV